MSTTMTASKKQGIEIPCSRRICLNCDKFDHYFTHHRGNIAVWHPTDRGVCRDTGKECDAYKKACKTFEFVKPR